MSSYKAAMDKFIYNADTGNFYHSDGKLAGYKNKSSGYWLLSIRINGTHQERISMAVSEFSGIKRERNMIPV